MLYQYDVLTISTNIKNPVNLDFTGFHVYYLQRILYIKKLSIGTKQLTKETDKLVLKTSKLPFRLFYCMVNC